MADNVLEHGDDSTLAAVLDRSHAAPVLLYFTATWCGPCKVFGPRLEEWAASHPDVPVVKIDGDEAPGATSRLGIAAYPSLVLLSGGVNQWTHAGVLEAEELESVLPTVLGSVTTPQGAAAAGPSQTTFEFPLRLHLPALADPRLSLQVLRRDGANPTAIDEVALPGEAELGEHDLLVASVVADDRLPQPLDLSILHALPAAPLMLTVSGRELPPDQLEYLLELPAIDRLSLNAAEPLSEAAVDIVTRVATQAVTVDAPGFDTDDLVARMPGVVVNFTTRSAAVAAALADAEAGAPSVSWASPEEFRAAVAAGGQVVAMVQAEHSADVNVAGSWHTAMVAGDLPDALTVSAYGDRLLRELAVERQRPAVVVMVDGEVRARRDLPHHDVVDLTGLLAAANVQGARFPGPAEDLPARDITVSDDPEGPVLELLAPTSTTVSAGLASGVEHVPAGWRVRGKVQGIAGLPVDALEAAGVQDLRIWVGDLPDVDLSGLERLTSLESLELYKSDLDDPATRAALAAATGVRSLRLLRADDDTLAWARSALSGTIVNGQWP